MIRDTSATDRPVERRGPTRALLWSAGALVLAAAAAALVWPAARDWSRAERSVDASRLRLARVERGDLERDVSVQGRVVAAFRPTLFSPDAGTVRLLVRAGDRVEKDQALARVESPELRSLLLQEAARLAGAESDLERQRLAARQQNLNNRQEIDLLEVKLAAARRAQARAEESREAGIINDVEFEKAQDDARILALEVEHARQKAELEADNLELEIRNRESEMERQRLVAAEVRRQVDELTLRSPADGVVSRVDVTDRDVVAPGDPILGVVDLSAYEIEIQVPEAYAPEIALDTPAVVTVDGDSYEARVKSMSPEVTGSQVAGVVAFVDAVPAGLKQNQRVATRLVLESRADILKVDRGPFLEALGGRQAYVLEGDLAVRRPIQVGAVSVGEVEILSGLGEGDEIIISDMTRYRGAETILVRR